MRIKYIIPFPLDEAGIANRAAQIPSDLLGADTVVECVPVRNHGGTGNGPYEMTLFDIYVIEAGVRAEDEGFDAVIMDSVSDSGLQALRSRLTIPVMGPGLASQTLALTLGRRFSIITMWDKWVYLLRRNLETYHLEDKCASIRYVNIPPDVQNLLTGKEDEVFTELTAEASKAVEEDGADVILLGSTTMHQATDYMAAHLPVPVINPGPVAIKMTEMLVQFSLSQSKVAYPPPSEHQDEKFFSLVGADGLVGSGE